MEKRDQTDRGALINQYLTLAEQKKASISKSKRTVQVIACLNNPEPTAAKTAELYRTIQGLHDIALWKEIEKLMPPKDETEF